MSEEKEREKKRKEGKKGQDAINLVLLKKSDQRE